MFQTLMTKIVPVLTVALGISLPSLGGIRDAFLDVEEEGLVRFDTEIFPVRLKTVGKPRRPLIARSFRSSGVAGPLPPL